MDSNVIEVNNLEHSYGSVKAVNNISFTVKQGEIFSFLGPNGAGKSTVINILTTLRKLQKGEARVNGYDVAKEPNSVRRSIGIVFQMLCLDHEMTVSENLEYHGRIYSMKKKERNKRIEELLKLTDLESKKDTLGKDLSGGMKRRLELARGLMTKPAVLFLDEPTIGFDIQTRMRMWEYLREIKREGTTIFLTTHYMEEADQLSDRISIIDQGRIIVTGTSDELKNKLGKDLIYLETSDNKAAAEILRSLESVKSITEDTKSLRIMIREDVTHVLPQIMEKIRREGIDIIIVNIKKPSMDDVFVHYTGHGLREGNEDEKQQEVETVGISK
ncbi:daunorubicin ABC transporter ATP-binding protein [Methanosarcina sp. A14]|uniref:ABC transporter, ATP-binding protein n=2 Tax=Methanosarcina barkeri TaxID=2208 RepID=A0A0E3QWX4_METBA|nr:MULTISPECIES: ATP-binding cassette domain-containing protein [Methanosarcina]AKB56234.1 ABC transporter, ATP-binding protein [Methanosarcina barkeri MS]AKJ40363.1 ABC transporter ATP-binding protein [Methanosarcina barkeri CM1]OEC91588.1 daunorubicin ABC transporter ATP-binding protein [Methanosarcina sp. A14]